MKHLDVMINAFTFISPKGTENQEEDLASCNDSLDLKPTTLAWGIRQ